MPVATGLSGFPADVDVRAVVPAPDEVVLFVVAGADVWVPDVAAVVGMGVDAVVLSAFVELPEHPPRTMRAVQNTPAHATPCRRPRMGTTV